MKKLTSYSLLLIYVPVSINFFLPVAAYNLNIKFIAEELCENKDKPELKCEGKCYLGNQMERQTGAKDNSEKKTILTNIYIMPHLIVNNDEFLYNFPRLISYSAYHQLLTDLFEDVQTPPPRSV